MRSEERNIDDAAGEANQGAQVSCAGLAARGLRNVQRPCGLVTRVAAQAEVRTALRPAWRTQHQAKHGASRRTHRGPRRGR